VQTRSLEPRTRPLHTGVCRLRILSAKYLAYRSTSTLLFLLRQSLASKTLTPPFNAFLIHLKVDYVANGAREQIDRITSLHSTFIAVTVARSFSLEPQNLIHSLYIVVRLDFVPSVLVSDLHAFWGE